MSQSDSNLEGETLGQFVVGNRLAAHPHLHWYNGSKVGTGESFWLGVPIGDVDSDCPAGFTSIDGIVEGSKIGTPQPLGGSNLSFFATRPLEYSVFNLCFEALCSARSSLFHS